jgi:hypothetical protein
METRAIIPRKGRLKTHMQSQFRPEFGREKAASANKH